MALSWNEIKDRALSFSKEWASETRENAEAKSFWDAFFNVFGISRRRIASFEEPVKKLNEEYGFIDLFWKGTLLVEHKSRGKDLDTAYTQALGYFGGLEEYDLPKYILVSDFEKIRLYDLDENTDKEFYVKDLYKNIKLFGFIAGYQKKTFKEEDPVNIKAAELMGKLHDQLKESGYTGHSLEVFLVRLLFCLFADDTGIFEKNIFKDLIELKTHEDGSDLGALLAQFFQVLNTEKENRLTNLDDLLNQFPFINGKLFEEPLPIAAFNTKMRDSILKCCALNWGEISPAIFGSMFQSVMNPEERRNLGAHYTSEKNILKLIKPLFLDELRKEFKKIKGNNKKLEDFHKKLGELTFFDPACGCGNFLVISYREIRLLELDVLRELNKDQQRVIGIENIVYVDVDQFYGIEIKEWPAKIAEVALWLMDHQMNLIVSEEFGTYFARLPLKKAAKIIHGNALHIDWGNVIRRDNLNYILGNPPFAGKQLQSKEQKEDMKSLFTDIKGSGVLDYVTAWYIKAARYIQNTPIKVAFVSTNSISQGEQVGILWNELINEYHIIIHFAHRSFKWTNEAKGKAAVHVVIIGFAQTDTKEKSIYDYENVKGDPHKLNVKKINPYLVEGENTLIFARSKPICNVQEIVRGSETTDNGHFLLSEDDVQYLKRNHPNSKKFIRKFMGGGDVLNNKIRWCLWLKDISANEYRNIPLVMKKINSVKEFREKSRKKRTREWARFPTLFTEDRQPSTNFLIIPKVSSERRLYIPVAYVEPETIINNTASAIANASLYTFGIIESLIHMTWVKYTCGRMKSDYIYSNKIVYNNFPWPNKPSELLVKKVEEASQNILNIREDFPESSLADLYDPLTMPPKLVKAHNELDRAVDKCYKIKPFSDESNRIDFLFDLYSEYINNK